MEDRPAQVSIWRWQQSECIFKQTWLCNSRRCEISFRKMFCVIVLVLTYEAEAENVNVEHVIDDVLKAIQVP